MATKKTKKAKITKLANLIVVDASGSMTSKVPEVQGGLRELLKQIHTDAKKDIKKTISSTFIVDFSNHQDIRTLVKSDDSLDLDLNLADKYTPRGATALYDAIAEGFSLVPKDTDSVFVNIITDGEENDSKKYNSSSIKELIEEAKKKNWVITFMCTTEASMYNARSLGISAGNTMTFANTKEGTARSLDKLSRMRSSYYAAVSDTANVDFATQKSTWDKMQTLSDDTPDEEVKDDNKK